MIDWFDILVYGYTWHPGLCLTSAAASGILSSACYQGLNLQ